MAHHGQPLSRNRVFLRCREGDGAYCGYRPERIEERLRFRRALPRTVRDTAPRRAGQESRRPVHRLRIVSFLLAPMRILISSRPRRAALLALSLAAVALFVARASTQSPRFYPDDPITREPESQDASKAAPYDESQIYELAYNLFVSSGHKASGLRAKSINTIDEVPDSSWFTNRVGTRPITNEELVRGANVGEPPDPS